MSHASIMKSVPDLDQDLSWIQVMRPAKSEAVVQKNSPVRNVETLGVHRHVFAEVLRKGKIECCVRLEMISGNRRITVSKARAVIDIG